METIISVGDSVHLQSLTGVLNTSSTRMRVDFSNTLQKSSIERLAEADVSEVVREVNEYFADFLAVNADLFSLGLDVPEYPLYMESPLAWNSETLRRVADGVCGVLLSLKKKPLIRYERNSSLAKKLAGEISVSVFIRAVLSNQSESSLYHE